MLLIGVIVSLPAIINCSDAFVQEGKFESGKIIVQLRGDISVETVFNFLYQRNLQINAVRSLTCESFLSSGNVDVIENTFSSRQCIYRDSRHVVVDGDHLKILVTLNTMIVDFQKDWIELMKRFQFIEQGNTTYFAISVLASEERVWVKTLSSVNEVQSAQFELH